MQRHYELEMSVGNVPCRLVAIQPKNIPSERTEKYFDHYHSYFEFHYAEQGESHILLSRRTVKLRAGELLIIPPRAYHQEVYCSDDSQKVSLSVQVGKPIDKAESGDLLFCSCFREDSEVLINIKGSEIEADIVRLKVLAEGEVNYVNREKIRVVFNSLMLNIFEHMSKSSRESEVKIREPRFSEEYSIDTYFAMNFNSNSGKDTLADNLNVSTRQLQRIIKKKYGKNYREKLIEIRVKIATSFLSDTDKSIAEIAELLGYSSPANFSTFLKKATGKTPSQVRHDRKM